MEKITTFLEILQVLLPIYCLYKLFIEDYKKIVILVYFVWVLVFFILKLWLYIPEFWSLEDKLLWSIPNIIFHIITLYLILTHNREDGLHRIS